MKRRGISIISILALIFTGLSARIWFIGKGDYAEVGAGNSTYSVTAAEKRATIFDCNMVPLTDTDAVYTACVVRTESSLNAMSSVLKTKQFKSLLSRLESGYPVTVEIDENISADGVTVIKGKRRYSATQTASHIIGYLNSTGDGVSGIEKAFNDYLNQNGGSISVNYTSDALGNILTGEEPQIKDDNYNSKSGVVLTIDGRIQTAAEKAMESIEKGAAIVIDIDTGKIRASVSRPDFSQSNISGALKSEKSPMLNRALEPYAVGSVFKIVTATAALESGCDTEEVYECTGSIKVGENIFNCAKKRAHGKLTMKEALEVSCNCYFINLSEEITGEKLLETAKRFGFGTETVLADGIVSDKGILPKEQDLASDAATANFAFGQGEFTATPLQIAAMASTIANGGTYNSPSLIEGLSDSEGNITEIENSGEQRKVVSEEISALLREYMISVVENGLGSAAKPETGSAGGKTATAQTGSYFENGEEKYNSWFAGFYPAEEPKYAIVVMKEEGSSGSEDCAPVFKRIADSISELD